MYVQVALICIICKQIHVFFVLAKFLIATNALVPLIVLFVLIKPVELAAVVVIQIST